MSIIAPLTPVERAAATKATADKFRGKPLSFADGVTCLHLLREQMLAFGYSPPEIPEFHDAKGARKALRSTGHRTIKGLLTELLGKPIPISRMRVGDVALGPGTGAFEAVGIWAGGKLLGFHEDGRGLVNIAADVSALSGAWRLI